MLKTTWVSAVRQFLPPAPSLPSRVALHGSLDIFTLAGWPRLRGVSALIKGAIVVTAFLGLLPATAHGELVYVSDLGANAVVVKDSSNGNEVARIPIARPIGIALNSTTRRGYISASGSGAVYVIDLDTNAVIPPAISVGGGPHGSALNEQTNRLYVANYAGGYVSVINTATNTLITNVSTGSLPFSVAVVKNTDKAYVAGASDVAEVDGLTNTVTRDFPLASANTGDITYASTVNKLFTADADEETVSVINLSTGAVSAVSLGRTPIRGFGPQGVAFDPGTNRVIVSTGDGWLVAIDATTEQIVASVRVATELSRLRISPSTRRIYAPSGTGTVYMVDADSLAPAGTLTGFVNAGYAETVPSLTSPRLFGIAIGQNDGARVRGDLSAMAVFDKLKTQPHWATADGNTTEAYTFVGNPDWHSKTTIEATTIISRLDAMNVQPGDTLIFYAMVHGGHILDGNSEKPVRPDALDSTGTEDEVLAFGLTDDYLKQYFSTPKWRAVRKLFFLDSCHSGGFFGSLDQTDEGDLDKLTKTALFAAAQEWEDAFVASDNLFTLSFNEAGMGVWTLYVLLPALDNPSLTTTSLVSRFFSPRIFPTDYLRYIGQDLFLLDGINPPGSHAVFTGNTPFFAATADFDLNTSLIPGAVPKPLTVATLSVPPNARGWNNTSVTVSLVATDDAVGSGIKQINFSTVGAQTGTDVIPGGSASVTIAAEGTTTLTYFATDNAGNAETPKTLILKIDKTPPMITGLPASGCALWPPNHKLVRVATVSGNDALSGLASLGVSGASTEPASPGQSDVVTTGPALGPIAIQLRAERLGTGNGRVYTLTATAQDVAGNTTTATATCVVPHDQGR